MMQSIEAESQKVNGAACIALGMGTPISLISERTSLAIRKYLDAAFLREQYGATLKDLEEARSYAVELVTAILIENPKETGYAEFCEKLSRARRRLI